MAGEATSGRGGMNYEGYRDYRGVPVIGAWLWDKELGFGLTAEIDVAEVYESLNIIRRTVGVVIGLTMILFSALVVQVVVRNRRLDSEIQERKQAEEGLYLFRELLDRSPDALYIIEPESSRFLDVNNAASLSLGYSRDELLSLGSVDISAGVDMDFWRRHIEELRVKNEITFEAKHIRRDSTTFPVEVRERMIERSAKSYLVCVVRDITERKRAGQELKKLFVAVEQSPSAVVITDVDGVIEYVNRKFYDLTGFNANEVIGKNPRILKSGFQPPEFYEEMWKTISSGEEWRGEFHNRRKDGTYFWESAIIAPIKDKDGTITNFIALKEDVTHQKHADERLRTFSLVVDQSPSSTIILDTDQRIEYVNPACVETTGYSVGELIGESVKILRSNEHSEEFYGEIWKTARSGKTWRGDICSLRKDGTKICELISVSPVIISDGLVSHFVSVKVDDAERKKAEYSLKTSEAMLKEAQKIAQMGHWELDITTNTLYWSDEIYRLFEMDPEKFGASYEAFLDAIHPDDREMVTNAYTTSLEQKTGYNLVHRLLMEDGRVKYVHERCETSYNEKGEPLRSLGTVQDITAISVAQVALKESEAQQRLLLDSTAEAIYGIDIEGNCTFANRSCVDILGFDSVDEILGKNMHDLIHHTRPDGSDYPVNECKIYEAFLESKGTHVDDELFWRKDGEAFDAEYWSHPIINEDEILGSVVTFMDITDRKLLENEAIKAQKLESVGLLAGGIAHDFNNLLTSIVGNTDFAKQLCKPGDKISDRLDKVEIAGRQAAALTQQLLTFSRGGDPVKRVVSILEIARESLDISLRGTNVTGVFNAPDDLYLIEADGGQISQVLNNLIINATQAMPTGGKVTVNCKNLHVESSSEPILSHGNYVKILVQDNGAGIDKENIKRIFDPYFTTKKSGTGLGLATSYSIIKNHGGILNVKSIVGKGTTFEIYLPAMDGKASIQDNKDMKVVKGTGRVLVMDDDAEIGDFILLSLDICGYKSKLVFNGEEAVQEYKRAMETKNPYSAVLVDLMIKGGMGGKEAIERLKEIDPKVVAIVSSGYANDPVMVNFEEYGFKGAIAKPYKVDDLGRVIFESLKKK
jgi:PAS domain S-box-containing protein